jgi:hypothetical protein
MILNLGSMPVLWATCDKTVQAREAPMLAALREVGVENPQKIDCPLTTPYYVGLAMGHVEALTRQPVPFLMLEDDARVIKDRHQSVFDIPDDTDALYLGTTTYGRWRGVTRNYTVIGADVDDQYMRIFNMLALHAVVYTSQRYVDHVVGEMSRYMVNPVGACDDRIADTMHRHQVLCLKKPVFFQDDGKANYCTTEIITPVFSL